MPVFLGRFRGMCRGSRRANRVLPADVDQDGIAFPGNSATTPTPVLVARANASEEAAALPNGCVYYLLVNFHVTIESRT